MVSFRLERVKRCLVTGVECRQCCLLTAIWMRRLRGGHQEPPTVPAEPTQARAATAAELVSRNDKFSKMRLI